MAFTPEDGTGLSNSNTYADVAFADAYFSDRNNTTWSAASETLKQAALIRATDYLDGTFCFIGTRKTSEQSLEWPRDNAVDSLGNDFAAVPTNLKRACAEYALRELSIRLSPDPVYDERGLQVRRTLDIVGSLESEVEYLNTVQSPITNRKYPSADKWLRDIIVKKGVSLLKL